MVYKRHFNLQVLLMKSKILRFSFKSCPVSAHVYKRWKKECKEWLNDFSSFVSSDSSTLI